MVGHQQWKCHQEQQALLEYADLPGSCPPGVYLSYHPSDPTRWTGVYFVRTGSYATAPLRFQLSLPTGYPETAPILVLSNDIFHPLVCPLTTYTYSTSSPSRAPVSSSDTKRLSPGSLNLQHGFPIWFGSDEKAESELDAHGHSSTARGAGQDDLGFSDDEFAHDPFRNKQQGAAPGSRLPFLLPPKPDALEWSSAKQYPSITQVLKYLVRAFEDEEFLDEVPLDDAANQSAHHAWHAYRRRVKELKAAQEAKTRQTGGAPVTPQQQKVVRTHMSTASPGRTPAQWNWDGVWQERVRKSVKSATADGKLFKDDEKDEHHLISFLDKEKEEVRLIKTEAVKAGEQIKLANEMNSRRAI